MTGDGDWSIDPSSRSIRGIDPILAGWAEGMSASAPDGAQLPAHSPRCLGCGPDNPHGHHLQVRRDGERVVSTHTFDERHMGAPGIAHGGAVATVFDDLFGFLLFIVGELAVTRGLQIDYRVPVRLNVPYTLTAGLDNREGRRLAVSAHLSQSDGRQIATATALFMTVTVEHFARALEM